MNNNPFVLPGFGQTGPMGQNPLLASMEMMRQAWEGLASSGGMDPAAMGRIMSVEEMDKRIADLRAVENWLRMNLSMLSSTIQGLEVQRATVATLKSFVDTGLASVTQPPASGAAPSPGAPAARQASSLDEVLGLKPAAAPQQAEPEQPEPSAQSTEEQSDILAAAASATQGWWNLLQQQFQNLASATAASAEGAMADFAEAGKAMADTQAAAQAAAAGMAASGGKPAAKTPAKRAGKTAAKTTVKKTAARKAAKTAAKAAPRTARKKTT